MDAVNEGVEMMVRRGGVNYEIFKIIKQEYMWMRLNNNESIIFTNLNYAAQNTHPNTNIPQIIQTDIFSNQTW